MIEVELLAFVVIYTAVVVFLSATLAGHCKKHESCTPKNVEACHFCGAPSDLGIYDRQLCLQCAEKLNVLVKSECQLWQDRHQQERTMKEECRHGLDPRLPCGDCQKAYVLVQLLRAESESHQTVYPDDRRRKRLLEQAADEIERLQTQGEKNAETH